MNYFSLLLACRYLYGAQQKKSISTMVLISFVGIFIGAFSLMLTLAVMHGFEIATCERLQSIHAQIIIRAFGKPINLDTLLPVLQHEFSDIACISPSVIQQVIIQNPHTDDISTVVGIKGIDPETASHINNLTHKLCPIDGQNPTLKQVVGGHKILIGKKLAESLDIAIGDTITLLFAPDEPKRKKISLMSDTATIGGFFATGIEEFDMGLIFSSIPFVHELFPDIGITHVYLTLQPYVDEPAYIQKLRNRLHIEVYSWKDLYPSLVSALKLEKYVMFTILLLISLIASMNIISLIFMHINQKQADIAILRAFGMSSSSIRTIFLYIGGIISLTATSLGILCALFCCWLLEHYPFISLPDAYFVTHLPIRIEWYHILMVFCFSICLSLIGIIIPLQRTEEIDITDVLRYNA